MFRSPLRERPTHGVVREMLSVHARAGIRRSPGWNHPWAWATRFQRERLEAKGAEYFHELNHRFAGVTNICLRSTGTTGDDELRDARGRIAMTVHLKTLQLGRPELFARDFWTALQSHAKRPIAPTLKRRFMLRQFVEDVPRGHGRDSLRRLGFEHEPGAPPINPKDLAHAREMYPLLRYAMKCYGVLLEDMTDGAIDFETVNVFQPPFGQFDDWLFEL